MGKGFMKVLFADLQGDFVPLWRFFHASKIPMKCKNLGEAGGHSNPEKCPRVVGNAAKWTMEILLDQGAVYFG